jgi:hypothetical protein
VWDIWSRAALAPLNSFLLAHARDFVHEGCVVAAAADELPRFNPVLSQAFMLAPRHRQAFLQQLEQQQQQQQGQQQEQGGADPEAAARSAVRLWHFEQGQHEAVFVPNGCAHAVRNLQSCCKVRVRVVARHGCWFALQPLLRPPPSCLRHPLTIALI